MSISAKPPAGEAPRSVRTRSSHKRTVTVVATFVLAIAFSFAGASTATAAPYCKGGPPGPCPGGGGWSSEPDNVIPPGWHAGQHISTDSDDGWCDRPGVCTW